MSELSVTEVVGGYVSEAHGIDERLMNIETKIEKTQLLIDCLTRELRALLGRSVDCPEVKRKEKL